MSTPLLAVDVRGGRAAYVAQGRRHSAVNVLWKNGVAEILVGEAIIGSMNGRRPARVFLIVEERYQFSVHS